MILYVNKKKLYLTLIFYIIVETLIVFLTIFFFQKSALISSKIINIIFKIILLIPNICFIFYFILDFLFYYNYQIKLDNDKIIIHYAFTNLKEIVNLKHINVISHHKYLFTNRIFIRYTKKLLIIKYMSKSDIIKIMEYLNGI